ncbi:MAG TPA: YihY/virulence factor BrkB family protein [Planctomycetota bacterium]|jgi:membrane protein|nr:YihY/virulence factor BrkB family protein [Planctomycetota bacterium]
MAKRESIWKRFWGMLRETFEAWSSDQCPRMAAALAYYTTFSVGPLLLISIAAAGLIFGAETARKEIMSQLGTLMGVQGADAIATVVENAGKNKNGSILATILGAAALLFGASGVFTELQTSLNAIWRVEKRKGRGILGLIKDRFLSFAMVLGIAFILLVSLVLSALLQALGSFVAGWAGNSVLMTSLYALFSLAVLSALFALMFKFLPDARVRWGDVWLGAGITAGLFTAGKFLIGLYLGKSGVAGKYGAAGSLVVFLVWVYYSAQILFIGAEFTRVWAEHHGGLAPPDEDAKRVVRRKAELSQTRS